MADSYIPLTPWGGRKAKLHDRTTHYAQEVALATENILAPYPASPVMKFYQPTTTAYVKVTPAPSTLLVEVAPTVTTDILQYTSVVVHKIGDSSAISTAAPTTDETDRLRANEFKEDCNAHMASLVYHEEVGPVISAPDATDDASLIALCQELDAALRTHAASASQHGGCADETFLQALNALALPATPTKAECRAYLGNTALKAAWDGHRLRTDNGIYMTCGTAVMPLRWRCTGSFYCKTGTSGGTFATAEYRSS